MKKSRINASSLRTMMLVIIFLIAGFLIGGFYYAQGWLNDFAVSSNYNSTPTTNNNGSQTEKQLGDSVSAQKVADSKAVGIIASSQTYATQIQQDLNKYASDTGVTISDFKTAESPTSTTTATTINGVQSKFVTVTLKNPVPYTNLIKFLKAIETSLPKMKLTGISLSRDDKSSGSVTVEPLTIGVYTR